MGEPGRPPYDEDWYRARLEEMRPYLVLGCSLTRAMDRAGLFEGHETVIREKYRLGDWFSRKIDAYRSTPGENGNEAEVRLVGGILDKIRVNTPLTHDELDILKHFNEKHRTAQPFFVSRTETAESKPEDIGKILDKIESDYANVGREAKKQMVQTNPPVQDQKQAGGDSTVRSELPTVQAPSGESRPPVQ